MYIKKTFLTILVLIQFPVITCAEETLAKVWMLSPHEASVVNVCEGCDQLKSLSENVYNALHNYGVTHQNMDGQLQQKVSDLLIANRITFPPIGSNIDFLCSQSQLGENEESTIFDSKFHKHILRTKGKELLSNPINRIKIKNGNEEILMIRGKSNGEDVLLYFTLNRGKIQEMSYYKLSEAEIVLQSTVKKEETIDPTKGIGSEMKVSNVENRGKEKLESRVFIRANGTTYQWGAEASLKASESPEPTYEMKTEMLKKVGSTEISGSLSHQVTGENTKETVKGKVAHKLAKDLGTVSLENEVILNTVDESRSTTENTTVGYKGTTVELSAQKSITKAEESSEIAKALSIELTPSDDITLTGEYSKSISREEDYETKTESSAGEINIKGFFVRGTHSKTTDGEYISVERSHGFGYASDEFGGSVSVSESLEDGERTGKVTEGVVYASFEDVLVETGLNLDGDARNNFIVISNDNFSLRGERGRDSEYKPKHSIEAKYTDKKWEAEVFYRKDSNGTTYGTSGSYLLEENEKITGHLERVKNNQGLTFNRGEIEYSFLEF